MDWELLEELKPYVKDSLDQKKNPKEVIQTLTELINHVTEYYL